MLPQNKYKTRTNEQIRSPEVRVIASDGKQLGIMPAAGALQLAREQGLDLVEVSPKAAPPVVKMINYDKYRYQQMKLAQAVRKNQKRVEVKGIRLSIRTGVHDLEFKAHSADKFLKEGNKVKIDLMLRGRELANVQYAMEQVSKFLKLISEPHNVETAPKKLGRVISTLLSPK